MNPIEVCLSGGRNKLVAAKAYEMFNAKYDQSGFSVNTPRTIRDVTLGAIPLWVESFGGFACVKV